ncbi:putative leucine-rich repeat domain superfamily [Helianthus debilis subsp. tardiflorus]
MLLRILLKVPEKSNLLVLKNWLNLNGRLMKSIRVFYWGFVTSGRMFSRFPNLIDADLILGSVIVINIQKKWNPSLGCEFGAFCIDSDVSLPNNLDLVPVSEVDLGLQSLCSKYTNLQRLVVANCSEIGLLNVADGCSTMQELVLHCCDDQVLRGIAEFKNLQILKLVGTVGVAAVVCKWWWSDIGLSILAQGCKRLVKLELRGSK